MWKTKHSHESLRIDFHVFCYITTTFPVLQDSDVPDKLDSEIATEFIEVKDGKSQL